MQIRRSSQTIVYEMFPFFFLALSEVLLHCREVPVKLENVVSSLQQGAHLRGRLDSVVARGKLLARVAAARVLGSHRLEYLRRRRAHLALQA